MEFDEIKAIEYINSTLAQNGISSYSDDEILNVIDIIWDYYEDTGLLDIDSDGDELIQLDDVISHVKKMLHKDKFAQIRPDDIKYIVEAEIAYEQSIGLSE